MALNLTPLRSALLSLRDAFEEHSGQPDNKLMRDGVIQRFEFSYELAWKTLKRHLEEDLGRENVDAQSRRELFRQGAEAGLLADTEAWFGYHRARNETSHAYDERKAAQVYAAAKEFLPQAEALLARLEQKRA